MPQLLHGSKVSTIMRFGIYRTVDKLLIEAAVKTALQKLENDSNPPDFQALVPGQIADLLSMEI